MPDFNLFPLVSHAVPHGSRLISLQVVAQRMKSVGNIQKITAAMKMVAASRLKGAQTKMEKSRGLVEPMVRLLGDQPGEQSRNLHIFWETQTLFFFRCGRREDTACTSFV